MNTIQGQRHTHRVHRVKALLMLSVWTLACVVALWATVTAFARPLATAPTVVSFSPPSATAGAGFTLVVTGTGFDATTSVAVNGISLTVESVDTNTITGTTAAGTFTTTGSYNVVVSNTDGVSTAAQLFTINPAAATQISLAPTSQTITAGTLLNFTAAVSDTYGNAIASGNVTWTIDSGPGSFTSQLARTATFTSAVASASVVRAAFTGTLGATANVTVTAAAASVITITPSAASNVSAGGTANFSAVAKDAFGNDVPASTIAWNSTDPTKGTVSPISGGSTTLTAGSTPGTFTGLVRALSGSAQKTADVTIVAGAASSLIITPTSATLAAGASRAFTAGVYDASNNLRPGDLPTWQASGGSFSSGAAPSNNPTYSAPTVVGTYFVTATFGGLTKTATINVVAGPATIIAVTPANPIALTPPSPSQALTAVAQDQYGNPTGGVITWTASLGSFSPSVNAGNATWSAPNNVAPATYYITVTSPPALPSYRTITVSPSAAASLIITPTSATLTAGATQGFTASVYDGSGNVRASDAPTWQASGGSLSSGAAPSNNPTYTPPTVAGTYYVTATVGGLAKSATITVNPAAPNNVVIVTPAANLNVNAPVTPQSFSAVVRDVYGNTISGALPNWSAVVGSPTSGTGTSFSYTPPNTPGSYTVSASYPGLTTTAPSRQVIVSAGTPTTLTISPLNASTTANVSVPFAATVTDAAGNVISSGTVTWQPAGIITGSGTGRTATFATQIAGSYRVTATFSSGSLVASTSMLVNPAGAASVTMSPNPISAIAGGGSQTLNAVVRDQYNNVIPGAAVTFGASAASWTITNVPPASATFTPKTVAGTYANAVVATVTSAQSVKDTATVNISAAAAATIDVTPANPIALTPPSPSVALNAVVRDAYGNPTGDTVTWSASGGSFSPGNVGNTPTWSAPNNVAPVTFYLTGTSSSAAPVYRTVNISPGPLTNIALIPTNVTLPVNGTQLFNAAAYDAYGNQIAGTVFNWSTSDPARASVSPNSGSSTVLTAKTTAGAVAGLLRVNAGGANGVTRTADVIITPGAPNAITIAPSSATLVVEAQRQFIATVQDVYGNPIPNSTLVWTVSGAQVGTVTNIDTDTVRLNAGTVAGVYPAGLRVSSGSLNQSASITLLPGPLAQVLLNPTAWTLKPNESLPFTAQGIDKWGNPIPGLGYAWSLNGPGSLTPNGNTANYQAGTAAGEYPKNVKVVVSQGTTTTSATADIFVNPADIASIIVSPASATLQPNSTQAFSARAFDSFGNEITSFGVNWSTLGTGFVESSGPRTAVVRAGTIVGAYPNAVRAAVGGVSGSASLTIVPGPLAVIDVQPAIAVMGAGNTQAFTAVGLDVWGNAVPDFNATWTSTAGVGSYDFSTGGSAIFHAGTAPGTYPASIKAKSGAVTGNATVIVLQGTVANVNIIPKSATVGINQTQLFTATVTDPFGNPFPQLSVLWQFSPSNIGSIVSSGPLTALVRMSTQAGTFVNGLQAFNGSVGGNATIVVPADPATAVSISADPTTLTTDGISVSTIAVIVADRYGNAVGEGQGVSLVVDQCGDGGTCSLGTLTAQTDSQGRIVTTLRSNHRSPTGATSTIRVTVKLSNGLTKSVTVKGEFKPFQAMLPMLQRDFGNNHESCAAMPLRLPDVVSQTPSAQFNIYRLTATSTSLKTTLSDYAATGKLLLYRITSDQCASSASLTLQFIQEADITSAALYQKTFDVTPGENYLLAVYTTANFNDQLYVLSVAP